MALILADRVRETSTTTGTGALTLAGAVVGYQTFSSAIGNTNTTYYAISNPGVAEWEVGIGTYATSGNTLTRTTIIKSSTGTSAINFSAGTKDVFVTYPATKSVYLDASGNVGIGQASINAQTRLAIAGANTITDSRGILSVNSTSAATTNFGGSISLGGEGGGATTPYVFGSIAGRYEGSAYSGYLQFSTTNSLATVTERMRIDSTGNVGIGTSSPQAKLQTSTAVDGAQGIFSGAQSTNEQTLLFSNAYYTNNATAGVAAIGWIDSGSSGGNLTFKTGTNGGGVTNIPTERMRITSAGLVGIDNQTPVGKLDITQATTNTSAIIVAHSGAGGGANVNYGAQINVTGASNTNTGVYSNCYGATNNYGVRIINPPASATSWALYSDATAQSYFAGSVGIGTTTPAYKLEISTDSAGKPGVGGLWTVVSDERIKSDIVPANLDRCYEIVKSVPLKYFGFAPGVYTDDQIQDKHNLGWIAQDVQKVFKNAVSVKPFTLKTDIPDGTEEYEEQDFTLEVVEKTETSIQVINGKAVQVSKVVKSDNKILLFDTVDVVDEAGAAVLEEYEVTPAVPAVAATDEIEAVEATEETEAVEAVKAVEAVEAIPAVMGTRPVTYQMPRMITKTRPKVRHNVIEDCLDLNSGQMIAALYGAVQALMEKVETLENRLTLLEAK